MIYNMWIDSHCHLHLMRPRISEMMAFMKEAQAHQVQHVINVATSMEEWPILLELAEKIPSLWVSVGIHPLSIEEEISTERFIAYAKHPRVVAIGETGLDATQSTPSAEIQKKRFIQHITVAKAVKKPLIIHSRDNFEEVLAVIASQNAKEVGGVLHCFTGELHHAQRAIQEGFYISCSGIITFKNAVNLQEVIKQIPLEYLLVETDSPYLAPTPFRGKSNQPAFIPYVGAKLAQLHQCSVEQVMKQTTKNCFKLFQL